jgi:SAM-dependent methyltransferase
MERKEWYADWFDSRYYHVLYRDRDLQEARTLIDNLVDRLGLQPGCRVLDLACGKGRHSVYLAQKGFYVTGVDLSEKSIGYANQFASERLEFFIHDMRRPLRVNYFDVVLNLFTSFGYFEKDADNDKAIASAAKALKPGGTLVIDFMNSAKVIRTLVKEETKTIEDINFRIRRYVENGFIVKEIMFEACGTGNVFHERVKALTLSDFSRYFDHVGLKVINLYGDYHLNGFDEHTSDRLIMVTQKNENGKK